MKLTVKLTLLISALALSGCLYSKMRTPGYQHHMTEFKLTTNDFQILGPVEARGSVHNVLFLVSWGGHGFQELIKEAKKLGGDDVINVNVDYESKSLFIVYNNFGWYARGMAIKYRKKTP